LRKRANRSVADGYAGAPYGICDRHPRPRGPSTSGHVVIRSTLRVDQDDAQVHIDSEQIPSILDGIPLRIRSVAVNVNSPASSSTRPTATRCR